MMGMASAGVIAPIGPPVPVARFDPLPQYSYGYDVQDALTGDFKGHQENRNGDLVTGSYSVVDPDGTRRIVDYTADSLNGFNAIVRREPLVLPAPARVIGPAPVPVFAPAPAPVAPAPPVFAPAPLVARGPVFPPAPVFAPAPLARLTNPYYF